MIGNKYPPVTTVADIPLVPEVASPVLLVYISCNHNQTVKQLRVVPASVQYCPPFVSELREAPPFHSLQCRTYPRP